MVTHLTGLGMFTRAATPMVPNLVSVAIDLGLLDVAPQAARPWACRVSVSLMRPGKDGLTNDMADIERLTTLAQGMVGRVAEHAVFTASTTGGGTRTWLLYAAGVDVATVTATVRSAVRMAFAEQADYVPHVAVELDRAWDGYRSLYPTAGELRDIVHRRAEAQAVTHAKAATQASVAALHAAGVDPSRATAITYRFTFATTIARSLFVDRVTAFQFQASPVSAAATPPADFPLELTRGGLPDVPTIHQSERYLIREAGRAGGRYDGWTSAA